MKKLLIVISSIVLVLLAGCQTTSYTPIDITANKDICYTCHMGIEDVAQANQALLEDGTPRVFDDIGCLVDYLANTSDKVKVAYVHDTLSGDWIDFSSSYFVQDAKIHSPMSYGITAFKSENDAKKYHEEHGGHLYTSAQLLKVDVKSLKTGATHGH